MTTWMSMTLMHPSNKSMESLYLLNDMMTMIVSSIFLSIIIMSILMYSSKEFNMTFWEKEEVEMIWTLTPMMIMMTMIYPSLKCLSLMESCEFCGTTIKIMGNQWYWTYQYPTELNMMTFSSYMKSENPTMRLMETDNSLIMPNNIPMKMMISSTDVIHSWTIPSLGLKMDAIPGRMNQLCTMISKTGTFFGQCSEICGTNHSFMPIVLESVDMKSMKMN